MSRVTSYAFLAVGLALCAAAKVRASSEGLYYAPPVTGPGAESQVYGEPSPDYQTGAAPRRGASQAAASVHHAFAGEELSAAQSHDVEPQARASSGGYPQLASGADAEPSAPRRAGRARSVIVSPKVIGSDSAGIPPVFYRDPVPTGQDSGGAEGLPAHGSGAGGDVSGEAPGGAGGSDKPDVPAEISGYGAVMIGQNYYPPAGIYVNVPRERGQDFFQAPDYYDPPRPSRNAGAAPSVAIPAGRFGYEEYADLPSGGDGAEPSGSGLPSGQAGR